MSHELQYTSVPQGLRAGSMGYCTVAVTRNIPPLLQEKLENLSGYRHLFSPFESNARLNPVAHQHLRLSVGGKTYSILSRIADAGVDYSNRTNKFAHHVAIPSNECPAANPAWVLGQDGLLATHWAGQPHYLETARPVPRGGPAAGVAHTWKDVTGDAGWAGVLAEAFLARPSSPFYVIFEPGQDVLPLFAEAIALLPPDKQWQVTFSTYYAGLSTDATCIWRAVVRGSPEAKQALERKQPVIDLARAGGAEGGVLVHLARTGERLAEDVVPSKPAKLSRPPTAKRVLEAEPFELTPLDRRRVKPRRSVVEFEEEVDDEPEQQPRPPWVFGGVMALCVVVFCVAIVVAIWLAGGFTKPLIAKVTTATPTPVVKEEKPNESVPTQPRPHEVNKEKPPVPNATQSTKPESRKPENKKPENKDEEKTPPEKQAPPIDRMQRPPQAHAVGQGGGAGTGGFGLPPGVNPPNEKPNIPQKRANDLEPGVAGGGRKGNSGVPPLPDPTGRQAQHSDIIPMTYRYLPEKNEFNREQFEFTIPQPFNQASFLEAEVIAGGVKMGCSFDNKKNNRILILGLGPEPDLICSLDWVDGKLVLAPLPKGDLTQGMHFLRSNPILLSMNGKPATLVAFTLRQDADKPDRKDRLTASIEPGELPAMKTGENATLKKEIPFRSTAAGLLFNTAVIHWSPKLRQEFTLDSLIVPPDELKLFKGNSACSPNCYTASLQTSTFNPKSSRFETTLSVEYRYLPLEELKPIQGITNQKALGEIEKANASIRQSNDKIMSYVKSNTPNNLSISTFNIIVKYKDLKLSILNSTPHEKPDGEKGSP